MSGSGGGGGGSGDARRRQGVACDSCGVAAAAVYCRADAARLCLHCDRDVHAANPLSGKHSRAPICDNCAAAPAAARCADDDLALCSDCDRDAHHHRSAPPHACSLIEPAFIAAAAVAAAEEAAMTSLGRRSGSYGSLPGAAAAARRPAKAALPAAGREGRMRWIQRVLVRRNVGMIVVFIFCLLVLIPHFSFSTVYVQNIIYLPTNHFWLSPDMRAEYGEPNTMPVISSQSASGENGSSFPFPAVPMSTIPAPHPCANFTFPPPPPAGSKRTGPRPCPVCYVPVEQAMAFMPASPSVSPVLKNLEYVSEDQLVATESTGGSVFGGYPSLEQRNDSYDIKESMAVHCGFVRGSRPGQGSGFDIANADLLEMDQCHGVVVASAIFGNYDIVQQPKNISEVTKRSVCFFMFVDEETEAYLKNSTSLDSGNRVGLWRLVVVRNLPYGDSRRNGKIPKLLLHRIFPNARYSLWIDGKLELVADPYQILERFLWRENASFAISRHYRRFDVFEEAEANKAAGKYDNSSIDYQIEFYKKEGLTPYSLAKLPITSDVPEGCVIIREHIPITNLFTCLWFNEVDRFTSRDQLSFSTVRDKIMSRVNWTTSMFMDCERRNFVIQGYHRDVLDQMHPDEPEIIPSPPVSKIGSPRKPLLGLIQDRIERVKVRRPPIRRGRDRRAGSRRHRPRVSTE